MLCSLSIIIQKVCPSLRVVTDKELEETPSLVSELTEAQQSSSITPPFQKEKVRERLSERYPIPPAFCTGRHGKCIIPKENNFKQPPSKEENVGIYRRYIADISCIGRGRHDISIKSWRDELLLSKWV
ncbi:unnamed protein product, partial [Vitis vinifera]